MRKGLVIEVVTKPFSSFSGLVDKAILEFVSSKTNGIEAKPSHRIVDWNLAISPNLNIIEVNHGNAYSRRV